MDNCIDSCRPLGRRYAYFIYVGRISPYTACHRSRNGLVQAHHRTPCIGRHDKIYTPMEEDL